MNAFDENILVFFNQFAFRSPLFDHTVRALADMYVFKGVLLIALLWWIWFAPFQTDQKNREIVIATLVGGFLALGIGRAMASLLPYRERPIYNSDLDLHFPVSDPTHYLRNWNAFPSDHAMLWIAVATGVFVFSRRVGTLALIYTVIFVCLPRIYLGLHHPTDIIAGAVLGFMVGLLMNWEPVRKRIARPMLKWSDSYPASFYMWGFLICYEMASQFDELRAIGQAVSRHI